jgi:hypothetical protein
VAVAVPVAPDSSPLNLTMLVLLFLLFLNVSLPFNMPKNEVFNSIALKSSGRLDAPFLTISPF